MSDVRLSKFLSLVLRHQPEVAGLTLDPAGWAPVDAVLSALRAKGLPAGRVDLERVVRTSDKQRFALSDDGHRIRANQGHSVPVDLGLADATPPDVLFHGTVARFLDAILAEGLKPGARHAVHLSADVQTATIVGARRGKPVILTVDAAGMVAAGHSFQVSTNGVWLTAEVPPRFLDRTG